MMGAWPFLVLGLILLILVILLLHRAIPSDRDPAQSSEDGETQVALFVESFPRQLADRLFGSEDWEFMAKQESRPLKRLFLQQRTALALSWLRGARANATQLMRVHSATARRNSRLEPLVELRVIADYFVFQMLCQVIALVISLRGPVAMGRLVGYAGGLSARLHEVITKMLPAELAYGNSKGNPAPPGTPGAGGQ